MCFICFFSFFSFFVSFVSFVSIFMFIIQIPTVFPRPFPWRSRVTKIGVKNTSGGWVSYLFIFIFFSPSASTTPLPPHFFLQFLHFLLFFLSSVSCLSFFSGLSFLSFFLFVVLHFLSCPLHFSFFIKLMCCQLFLPAQAKEGRIQSPKFFLLRKGKRYKHYINPLNPGEWRHGNRQKSKWRTRTTSLVNKTVVLKIINERVEGTAKSLYHNKWTCARFWFRLF